MKTKSKSKYSWLAETGLGGVPRKVKSYRGFEIKLNPLSEDWLVDIGGEFGAYVGEFKEMKKIVDRYYEYKESR